MAEFKVGPFVDEVLRRTRDPQAGGTSRSQTRLLLGHAQRIINAATDSVLVEREFPLEPMRVLYDLDEVAQVFGEAAVRIASIRVQDQTLIQDDWKNITRLDRNWLRTFGAVPHSWAPVGGNLFIVYPGPHVEKLYCTLVLVRLTPLFDSDDGDVLLPKELHTRLLDLTEAFVFLRRRQPADVLKALQRAALAVAVP